MTPLASPNPTRVETFDASLLAFWGKTGDADEGGDARAFSARHTAKDDRPFTPTLGEDRGLCGDIRSRIVIGI